MIITIIMIMKEVFNGSNNIASNGSIPVEK
jgi:hypothetical protein